MHFGALEMRCTSIWDICLTFDRPIEEQWFSFLCLKNMNRKLNTFFGGFTIFLVIMRYKFSCMPNFVDLQYPVSGGSSELHKGGADF